MELWWDCCPNDSWLPLVDDGRLEEIGSGSFEVDVFIVVVFPLVDPWLRFFPLADPVRCANVAEGWLCGFCEDRCKPERVMTPAAASV